MGFKQKIKRFFNYLFPDNIMCIFCGNEIKEENRFHICKQCLQTLPFNKDKVCRICGTKITDEAEVCSSCFHALPPFKMARSPFVYEFPISTAIASLKFENAKYLAKPLGEFLIDEFVKMNITPNFIIPMPLSENRLKERGYNQAELLAEGISQKYNIPIKNDLIARRNTKYPQSKLDWKERQENVKDIFSLKKKKVFKNKIVLIVDDVMTTGATIKSLCNAISKGQPKSIYILTLAHTYINRNRKTKKINLLQKITNKLKLLKNKFKNNKK